MSDKFILDVSELAVHLGCQPSTVREAARCGRLPGLKFGDDWVFPRDALLGSLNREALEAQYDRKNPTLPTPVLPTHVGVRVDRRRRPMPNLDGFTPVGGNA